MTKILACILLTSCALTSKAPPLNMRYFTPEPLTAPGARSLTSLTEHASDPQDVARIRLGRVSPSAHLRYSIVHRGTGFELQPYEELRWTERPDAYVQRALAHALFDSRALVQAVDRRAPTLDVEVVAFEEVRRGSQRLGRVELRYQLSDDATVLASGAVTVERPARGGRIEDVVAAISEAMTAATAQVAERVARACNASSSETTASLCAVPRSTP